MVDLRAEKLVVWTVASTAGPMVASKAAQMAYSVVMMADWWVVMKVAAMGF